MPQNVSKNTLEKLPQALLNDQHSMNICNNAVAKHSCNTYSCPGVWKSDDTPLMEVSNVSISFKEAFMLQRMALCNGWGWMWDRQGDQPQHRHLRHKPSWYIQTYLGICWNWMQKSCLLPCLSLKSVLHAFELQLAETTQFNCALEEHPLQHRTQPQLIQAQQVPWANANAHFARTMGREVLLFQTRFKPQNRRESSAKAQTFYYHSCIQHLEAQQNRSKCKAENDLTNEWVGGEIVLEVVGWLVRWLVMDWNGWQFDWWGELVCELVVRQLVSWLLLRVLLPELVMGQNHQPNKTDG